MSEDILMDEQEIKPMVHAIQPLEYSRDDFLMVTITFFPQGEDQGVKFVNMFVMPDSDKTRIWLEGIKNHDTSVEYTPVVMRGEPKAVHIVLPFENGIDSTACRISVSRWEKYHQTLDQAFHRVAEKPTCKSCIKAVKGTLFQAKYLAGELDGAVLKQWSWDHVDPDYRPGGPQHRFNRVAP